MTAPQGSQISTETTGSGRRVGGFKKWSLGIGLAIGGVVVATSTATPIVDFSNDRYAENLGMIKDSSVRSTEEDNSQFKDTPIDQLPIGNTSPLITMDRSTYTGPPNHTIRSHKEAHFPTFHGGQNRTSCEFSHFAYDDPIVFPDEPGKAHLHMFFGNTDVNAYTTQETLEDSGGGTCNGKELNRSGYWAPAMFDGQGGVRVPERIVVYYKGEGFANNARRPTYPDGTANTGAVGYERGMRAVAPMGNDQVVETLSFNGGEFNDMSQVNYKCSNNYSGYQVADGRASMPVCDGNYYQNNFNAAYPGYRTVLEMEIKFWNCWPEGDNRYQDYEKWSAAGDTRGRWFFSNCTGHGGQSLPLGAPPLDDKAMYPNFNYFVNYVVEPGETTAGWHLSSDVDPATLNNAVPSLKPGGAGSTHHADVWWNWHPQIQDEWIDNCVNFATSVHPNQNGKSGCGFGYLSTGGADQNNPLPGRALVQRAQYSGPFNIPAQQIFNELCVPLGPSHTYSNPRHAALCKP